MNCEKRQALIKPERIITILKYEGERPFVKPERVRPLLKPKGEA
jgi:hypothetical protein